MDKRTRDLLNEMQGIFGESFGSESSFLTEDRELFEAPGRRMGKMRAPDPSPKRGKERYAPPQRRRGKEERGKKGFDTRSPAKIAKLAKAAALKNKDKDKQREQERAYQRALDDLRGKKLKGRAEPARAKQEPKRPDAATGGGAKAHSPFKHQSSRGKGPGTPPNEADSKKLGIQQDPVTKQDSKTGCWDCSCSGNTGTSSGKCKCTSTGRGKNCPPKGSIKMISFQDGYKDKYNRHYRAWKRKGSGSGKGAKAEG